ncbi:MAG: adenylate cyclase regulatory domain-containing protein [Acidimicrobiales bacterium]
MSPSDDPAARAEARLRVHAFLRARDTSEEEIARAEAEDVLDLLVAEQLLVPSRRRFTSGDVAERTGMSLDVLRRFWRALGFPDVAPDDPMFTDLDIEALLVLRSIIDLGVADVETGVQLARVIGSSMARIAEAEVSPALRGILTGAGSGDSVEAADRIARMADVSLPAMARLLDFVWRRHVQAAIRRAMSLRTSSGDGALPVLAVGFADMVGFTTLSQQLSEEELAAVVGRFEELAHDTVTAGGGRVVKMIGDEAMFVADSAPAAARIGLNLAEVYADDELLSDVRVALAVGPVLVQDGDYYGPVVNLASRVVSMAAPGSVLVTDDFHAALENDAATRTTGASTSGDGDPGTAPEGEFAMQALRLRPVKDLGRVQLWVLYRPGAEPVADDRRMGRRWDRLADVLLDLDDLRERGERLISARVAARAARSGPGQADGGDAEGPELE